MGVECERSVSKCLSAILKLICAHQTWCARDAVVVECTKFYQGGSEGDEDVLVQEKGDIHRVSDTISFHCAYVLRCSGNINGGCYDCMNILI